MDDYENLDKFNIFSNIIAHHWKPLKLKQHHMFQDLPVTYQDELDIMAECTITHEQIKYLYTEILQPSDLLTDINKIGELLGGSYFFGEEKEIWEYIE